MDKGSTWFPAKLGKERERYAWQSFEYEFDITRPGSYLLMSRATDDKGKTQPVAPQWNPSGYLWNVIDKVRINVKAKTEPDQIVARAGRRRLRFDERQCPSGAAGPARWQGRRACAGKVRPLP